MKKIAIIILIVVMLLCSVSVFAKDFSKSRSNTRVSVNILNNIFDAIHRNNVKRETNKKHELINKALENSKISFDTAIQLHLKIDENYKTEQYQQ